MSKNKDIIEVIKETEDVKDISLLENILEDENESSKSTEVAIDKDIKKETKIETSLNYIGRGFNTLKEAEDFVNTETFARLGIADKNEYTNWLNNK